MRFSLTQLLEEFTIFESIKKDNKDKTGEVNVAEPSSSRSTKRKRFAGKAKGKPKPKKAQSKKKKAKSKYDLLVLESCIVEDDSSPWIIDSRATNHVCSSMQWAESWTQLEEGSFSMRVGSRDVVSTRAVGVVRLHFGSCFIILDNVYLISGFTRNLISVSKLLEQLYFVSFNNKSVIIQRMV